jgi:predicted membrane protein (TIGR00267 family)
LIRDLKASDYGRASRYLPIMIALVNGFSPLILCLLILSPLFLAEQINFLFVSPFINSILVALVSIFLLGVFLGKISQTFWLWSGLRTLFIALFTIIIILSFSQ